MIHDAFEDFAATLPQMTALVGLDFGEKTIGVAVSDRIGAVATPLETIRRKKFTSTAIACWRSFPGATSMALFWGCLAIWMALRGHAVSPPAPLHAICRV